MGTFSGMASTFDLPNYAGQLMNVSPTETPFLSAIGGLAADSGDMAVMSTSFTWQTEDLAAPTQPAILEGADPTNSERTRSSISNVVQIFQYGVKVTYSKLAATQQLAQNGNGQSNPITDELNHQIDLKLLTAARDVNYSFLRGVYQAPSDNTTARKTRGLISAITTNAVSQGATSAITATATTDVINLTAHGFANGQQVKFTALTGGAGLALNTVYWVVSAATNTFKVAATKGGAAIDITTDYSAGTLVALGTATETQVLDLVQSVYDGPGVIGGYEPTFIVNSSQKRLLSKIFIKDRNYQEMSRTIGGVNVQQIESDFGPINILLDRAMPSDTLVFAHLRMCAPRFLQIPTKGFLFVEPVAKTGAYESYMLYGECGLAYGYEAAHAKMTELSY